MTDYRNGNTLQNQNCGLQGYVVGGDYRTSEPLPSDAAGIVALAKRRIAEIDKRLSDIDGLKAEREKLLAIVEAGK